jgi:protein-S-isoprenylcysteine O-methyltransferase Ste14
MSNNDDMPFPWNYIGFPRLFKLLHCDPVGPDQGLKHKIPIDAMKALTLPVCLYFANSYGNYTSTMMTYTALHGTYGLLWLFKSQLYPDMKWEKRVPWSQAFVVFSGLGVYWLTPFLIAKYRVQHSPIYLACMIMINIFGVFLHYGSDIQKTISLELRPGKLITDRFFGLARHPNYLGEFLIYSSFVLLGNSWLMVLYFLTFVAIYWVPNMWLKEKSMSRYEEWKLYSSRVKMLRYI